MGSIAVGVFIFHSQLTQLPDDYTAVVGQSYTRRLPAHCITSISLGRCLYIIYTRMIIHPRRGITYSIIISTFV